MNSIVVAGALGSLAAGLVTGIGALPVLFGRALSERARDTMLGFAAGVMLAASFFSLLLPGIEEAVALWGSAAVAASVACAGFVVGAMAVSFLNRVLPHEHFLMGPQGADPGQIARIWLFVMAITIHNFPEGMAVGVGFGGGDMANGIALAIGIGLQNAPEGLAVAVALHGLGYSGRQSFAVALLTGLIEPVGGLIGVIAVQSAAAMLPWGLAFAAGAMIYVISHEIIPETHRGRNAGHATAGLIVGFLVMMFLDVALA